MTSCSEAARDLFPDLSPDAAAARVWRVARVAWPHLRELEARHVAAIGVALAVGSGCAALQVDVARRLAVTPGRWVVVRFQQREWTVTLRDDIDGVDWSTGTAWRIHLPWS